MDIEFIFIIVLVFLFYFYLGINVLYFFHKAWATFDTEEKVTGITALDLLFLPATVMSLLIFKLFPYLLKNLGSIVIYKFK